MPKAARIDGVKTNPNGTVSVEYTAAEGPFPPPGGHSLEFPSMKDVYDAVVQQEAGTSDMQLVLMALASWVKADPQMLTPALARNRTAMIDYTGTAQAVKLG